MKTIPTLNSRWVNFLPTEAFGSAWQRALSMVERQYERSIVFPAKENLFKVFDLIAPEDVKIVIIGQDPYHQAGQANGIAFSVSKTIAKPPSLKNIFKEIKRDLGIEPPTHGDLTKWVEQGVLLLNCVLSVEEGKPGSHSGIGWEVFTNHVIHALAMDETPKVFMLWGNHAKLKSKLIPQDKIHLVLETSHPSPLSFNAGFNGCMHFSIANKFLKEMHREEIDWNLNP